MYHNRFVRVTISHPWEYLSILLTKHGITQTSVFILYIQNEKYILRATKLSITEYFKKKGPYPFVL